MKRIIHPHFILLSTILLPVISDASESSGDRAEDHHSIVRAIAECSQRGDAELAIEGCTVIIRSTLLNAELMAKAYNNRGNAYDLKGQLDHSIIDYTKAIELSPHYANAYFNRGYSYARKNKFDLAIADFDKTIVLKPNLALAYNSRGYVYEQKGQLDSALLNYSKAIQLEAEFLIACINRDQLF